MDSASLRPAAAAAAMEAGASPEPDTAEVLPQHKFDSGSLEAYLNQHLPGFGAEPEAKLTVTQYRYRPGLLQQKQICALAFSSFGSGWGRNSPHPGFFTDALCRWELRSAVPCVSFWVFPIRGQ